MDPNRSGWERLQHLLERLQPGDEIRVVDTAAHTGLDASMCEMVLTALARVDLFTPKGDGVYRRRRIMNALDDIHVAGPTT